MKKHVLKFVDGHNKKKNEIMCINIELGFNFKT
jgi:hypothetical protein